MIATLFTYDLSDCQTEFKDEMVKAGWSYKIGNTDLPWTTCIKEFSGTEAIAINQAKAEIKSCWNKAIAVAKKKFDIERWALTAASYPSSEFRCGNGQNL